MLTQKVFGLSSVTEIMKGLLLQTVRNWTNLKQLCTLVSLERQKKKKKNVPDSLPSNMFYNLLLWYCVLYGFILSLFLAKAASDKRSHFASHLAFGRRCNLPLLWLGAAWTAARYKWLRNVYHS